MGGKKSLPLQKKENSDSSVDRHIQVEELVETALEIFENKKVRF